MASEDASNVALTSQTKPEPRRSNATAQPASLPGSLDQIETARCPLLSEYLNHTELAKELGLTTRTLRTWRRDGCGPPFLTLRRRLMYRRVAVSAWLHEQERSGPPEPPRKPRPNDSRPPARRR